MRAQLIVIFVMEAFDSRVLDRPVHPFDLSIGPGVVRLGQAVLYTIGLADHVEPHGPGIDRVAIARLLGELDTIVGQDGMDPIGHGFEHVLQELPGRFSVSRCNELSDGELGSSVNAYKEIELTFGGLYLSNINVEEPDGVALELLALRLVAFDIR